MHRISLFIFLGMTVCAASLASAENDQTKRLLKRLRLPLAKKAASDYLAAQKKLSQQYGNQVIKLREQLNSELEVAVTEATSSKDFNELQNILDAREVLQETDKDSPPLQEDDNSILAANAKLRREIESLKRQAKKKVKQNIPAGAVQFGGKTYFVFEQEVTWHHADKLCKQLGGYVVRVESQAEHEFLKGMLNSIENASPYYWIDGSDAAEEGTWIFSNGKPMDYLGWSAKEPGNWANAEHNAYLYRKNQWQWGDFSASGRRPFICEWD